MHGQSGLSEEEGGGRRWGEGWWRGGAVGGREVAGAFGSWRIKSGLRTSRATMTASPSRVTHLRQVNSPPGDCHVSLCHFSSFTPTAGILRSRHCQHRAARAPRVPHGVRARSAGSSDRMADDTRRVPPKVGL